MSVDLPYCRNPYRYQRRSTRVVFISGGPDGPVGVGGTEPIRVQSMTTTDTRDTAGTVAQIVRLVEAGCELVRVTAPKVRDAENLGAIRTALLRRGVRVPLVADIHFLPDAAMAAVPHADKIRINPGNYADRKVFEAHTYTDEAYALELERIASRFVPLVRACKTHGRAMRIGTNHGSLSDRILSRYGDTPLGMVESALEFVRICREEGYHELVLSMKASGAAVMIEANRLLAARLDALGWDYPIHLGVTEAGDGEDGRIKSAIGIGSLLADGIGDTIRVSLTEEPEAEIPACRAILAAAIPAPPPPPAPPLALTAFTPFAYARRAAARASAGLIAVGAGEPPRVGVIVSLDTLAETPRERLQRACARSAADGRRKPSPDGHDGIEWLVFDAPNGAALEHARRMRADWERLAPPVAWAARLPLDPALAQQAVGLADALVLEPGLTPAPDLLDAIAEVARSSGLLLVWRVDGGALPVADAADAPTGAWRALEAALRTARGVDQAVCVAGPHLVADTRYLVARLRAAEIDAPLILEGAACEPEPAIPPATALGALLCDGIGDAVWLSGPDLRRSARVAYNLLQGTGRRITKTEFISCPSCGRTKFDLQSTTERIKARTGHLKDVRIAIMGCIVNGPGEMADADFGYVGAGRDRISLYVGKECVERDIPQAEADERLVQLIRRHGRWVEPESGAEEQEKECGRV